MRVDLIFEHNIFDSPALLISKVPPLIPLLYEFGLLHSLFEPLAKCATLCGRRKVRLPLQFRKFAHYLLVCDSIEMTTCCYHCKDIKMLKSRAVNYYCQHHLRNMVSVFGNEKAWELFDITKKYRCNITSVETRYYNLPITEGVITKVNKYTSAFSLRLSHNYQSGRVKVLAFDAEKHKKLHLKLNCLELNALFPRALKTSRRKIVNNTTNNSIRILHDAMKKYYFLLSEDGENLMRDIGVVRAIS